VPTTVVSGDWCEEFEIFERRPQTNCGDLFGKYCLFAFHGPNDDSTHPQFGIGALWHFSPQFSLRLDLDRNFDVGKKFALHADTNGRFDNIDAYTLNLIWKP
jgi:hypothetical protein